LKKRRKLDSDKCLFCEKESIEHLFFSCVVAKQSWLDVSEAVGFPIGLNFESTAKCWLCNKKFGIVNLITSAVCWGIWKLRNLLCFQEGAWKSMKQLWHVVVPMIRCLEHPTATEANSWIRRCNGGTGEEGYGAAVDRRQPRSWRKECYI
jgi:hypothetical protein